MTDEKGSINQDPIVANNPAADRRVRRGGAWVSFNVNCSVNYLVFGDEPMLVLTILVSALLERCKVQF